MTSTAQTLSIMLESLPPREQESVLDKIRPIIAETIDELKWNSVYQKSSTKLETFAQNVRAQDKKLFDANKL